MHEQVIELLSHANKHIMGSELMHPSEIVLKIASLFLPTVISTYDEIGVAVNCTSLLFY